LARSLRFSVHRNASACILVACYGRPQAEPINRWRVLRTEHLLAQGSLVASKDFIAFREILIFKTNWGICFRSNRKFHGWNRWGSGTVLAQLKS
jgi:hypothetical protein